MRHRTDAGRPAIEHTSRRSVWQLDPKRCLILRVRGRHEATGVHHSARRRDARLAVGCACAAGRQGLSNRVFKSGLSCGGGLPRSGTLRVRTSSSRRAGSTEADTIGLRARRPVGRSESRRYRHIRDRREFWRPGAPQRVSSRHAQVITKRRTHRSQNAGVALNRRHLLRSVFATAIWSRACQPATVPMAR
jgi:hypothetical protein